MNPRILIVEDEEDLTLLLRYNLEAAGYEVETVARGDEADLRFKERTPDLVILDWMLPGLSGIEICRRLRARPDTKALPIIMLTARAPSGWWRSIRRSTRSSTRSKKRPCSPSPAASPWRWTCARS